METKRIYTNKAFIVEVSPIDESGVHIEIMNLLGDTRLEFDLSDLSATALANALLVAVGESVAAK